MTPEQRSKLISIGRQVIKIFPDAFGNIFFKFNLQKGRKNVIMNYGMEESIKESPEERESPNK